jgi:hypothetical protein
MRAATLSAEATTRAEDSWPDDTFTVGHRTTSTLVEVKSAANDNEAMMDV